MKEKTTQLIGAGVYGEVYEHGLTQAVKHVACDADGGLNSTFIVEADIYSRIHNSCLVKGHVRLTKDGSSIIMDRYETDLSRYIQTTKFSERLNNFELIATKILIGLSALHQASVSHNDIKPNNVLINVLTKNNSVGVGLADFGLCSAFWRPTKCSCTSAYRPPELFGSLAEEPSTFSSAIDIWALGCTLAELLLERPLFDIHSISDVWKFSEVLGDMSGRVKGVPVSCFVIKPGSTIGPGCSRYLSKHLACSNPLQRLKADFAVQLISNMLQVDPTKRLGAENLLNMCQEKLWSDRTPTLMLHSRVLYHQYKTLGQRWTLIERIQDTCLDLRSSPECYFLAVSLFDRVMCSAKFNNCKLVDTQIIASACISIAMKYTQDEAEELSAYQLYHADNIEGELSKMERLCLECVNYQVGFITPYTYLLQSLHSDRLGPCSISHFPEIVDCLMKLSKRDSYAFADVRTISESLLTHKYVYGSNTKRKRLI